MNILLRILCYPSLVWILPSNLEVKTKKIKKRSSSQNLRRLDYVHLICLAVSYRKKRLLVPVFGQKFANCATTKVYSHLRSSTSDLQGHCLKCHPLCIGVARIFDWGEGGANQKSHAMKSSEIFERGIFVDKDIVEWNIRSRGLVWHLTESFLKGECLKQKFKMKLSKLGDLCK